jgi:hypothetical protein
MVEPPVRLCCSQRHWGSICPDGKVMCQLCFERFEVKDLNEILVKHAISGEMQVLHEDVCKPCAEMDAVAHLEGMTHYPVHIPMRGKTFYPYANDTEPGDGT